MQGKTTADSPEAFTHHNLPNYRSSAPLWCGFILGYCARIIDRELPIERYKGRFTIATNALLVFSGHIYERVEVLTLRHCRKSSDLIPLSEMFMSKTMFIFYIFRLPSFYCGLGGYRAVSSPHVFQYKLLLNFTLKCGQDLLTRLIN